MFLICSWSAAWIACSTVWYANGVNSIAFNSGIIVVGFAGSAVRFDSVGEPTGWRMASAKSLGKMVKGRRSEVSGTRASSRLPALAICLAPKIIAISLDSLETSQRIKNAEPFAGPIHREPHAQRA
jgi:hypothetical protein